MYIYGGEDGLLKNFPKSHGDRATSTMFSQCCCKTYTGQILYDKCVAGITVWPVMIEICSRRCSAVGGFSHHSLGTPSSTFSSNGPLCFFFQIGYSLVLIPLIL